MDVQKAIEELEREIPDAYPMLGMREDAIILTKETAELVLEVLRRLDVQRAYGVKWGDEDDSHPVAYTGSGEEGLERAQRKAAISSGDKIVTRVVLNLPDRHGEWEEIQ